MNQTPYAGHAQLRRPAFVAAQPIEDKLSSVFEPFVQLERNLSSIHEGTGLELAISRDLARGMNGELSAVSAPGIGSTFELSLKQAHA